MSSPRGEYALGASHGCAAISVALHAGALSMLAATRVDAWLIAAMLPLCAAMLARDLADTAYRVADGAVRRVLVDATGWTLVRGDGTRFGPAAVVDARAWFAGLSLTLADTQRARRRLLIPADALDADAMRRLRVSALGALAGASR